MKASKQKYILKKRLRKTTIIEPDILEDQVVNIGEDEEIEWTDSEEEKSLDSKALKKFVAKGKGHESASTKGIDSHAKRKKIEKPLTKDQRMRLLEVQKVLNGRVFESVAKYSPGMR